MQLLIYGNQSNKVERTIKKKPATKKLKISVTICISNIPYISNIPLCLYQAKI